MTGLVLFKSFKNYELWSIFFEAGSFYIITVNSVVIYIAGGACYF